MISVQAQVDIAVSPERVWRVLMDFANHRKWHPFVELEGNPSLGSQVNFYFRRNPATPRGWKSDATVTRLEPLRDFAVEFGVAGLLMVEQWYRLEESSGGTRVTYGSDCRGILPKFAGGFFRKRFLLLHQLPLDRLAQGFTRTTPAGASVRPTKRARPRKGFRGYRGK